MIETIAIVLGVVTAAGGIAGAGYKCYRDMNRQEEAHQDIDVEIHNHENPISPPPSPVIERAIKNALKHHMENKCNSDSDTEIDIRISIHTHMSDEDDSKK